MSSPTSPTKPVPVPDSPLHSSVAPFAAPPSPRDRHPRPSTSSTSDDDEIILPASSTSKKGHRSRPSASALLGVNDDRDALDPRDLERQRRLREYEHDEGTIGRWTRRASKPFVGLASGVKKNEGLLLIALSQVFFACMNVCVKLLQSDAEPMPVWELIFIRMFVTFLGCYGWLRWTGDPNPFLGPPGVRGLLIVRGVIGFFGLFPGYYALRYLSLSDATTISFLSPVLVGILAFLLLREPYSRLEALVGLTSLLGTLFIAKPHFLFPPSTPPAGSESGDEGGVSDEQRMLAVGVALIGVLGASGAYLTIRKIGKRASPLHSISYFSFYCVVVSLLYPLILPAPPVFRLEQRFFLLIAPIGVFGFIAQALLTMGLQREKAGRGTLAVYSNLIFAMALEYLVFHALPDAWSLLGALIIVGGAVRVALEKKPVVDTATSAPSRRGSVVSVGGGRRGSTANAMERGGVEALAAAEEGRKSKGKGGEEQQEERPLSLSSEGDDGLGREEDELEEEDEGGKAGGSGFAAARGLDAER
ncbi:hypothetical protein JCM8547_002399 [Rhodosporidiobolus lusitaniae]